LSQTNPIKAGFRPLFLAGKKLSVHSFYVGYLHIFNPIHLIFKCFYLILFVFLHSYASFSHYYPAKNEVNLHAFSVCAYLVRSVGFLLLALGIKLVITVRRSSVVEVFSSLKGTGLPYNKGLT
jgi:hypothetical protein